MDTAKEIGGDFYDFFFVDNSHLAVVMADVSGKGIPAALFMMTARTLIKNLTLSGKNPGEILTEANSRLCENNEQGMFVTTWLGIWDIANQTLAFANAGHNPPLLSQNGKAFDWLKVRPGFVLAGMEGIRYRTQEIAFGPQDKLFLYTDGVTEALNPKEELYGEERLLELFRSKDSNTITPKEMLETIRKDISVFANGAEQADDITMLFLKANDFAEGENDG